HRAATISDAAIGGGPGAPASPARPNPAPTAAATIRPASHQKAYKAANHKEETKGLPFTHENSKAKQVLVHPTAEEPKR
ncbi:MAG: hypothetical protein SF187_03830, partial [Deltaproteobacteria bacterium]|nr:hypothetical protein [Deltaproteobacteria bacterium]